MHVPAASETSGAVLAQLVPLLLLPLLLLHALALAVCQAMFAAFLAVPLAAE
jgi:hypothetical protein